MLKAMATSMPVYCMNIFKLPKGLTDDLNKLLADYWWDKRDQKSGKHWFAWKRLCTPKKEGGLGFRDFEAFNLALLAKQAWRILQKPECLMARVLKGKYFPQDNILHTPLRREGSFVWQSIVQGRDLLNQGMRFVIGDGQLVHAWDDPWLPITPPRPPIRKEQSDPHLKVADFIIQGTGQWNINTVRQHIVDEDILNVLAIKLCATAQEDMLGWHYTSSGQYTVKSGYWLATNLPSYDNPIPTPGNTALKAKIWKIQTASKLQHFLWKALSNILPTGEFLQYRHISNNPMCPRCCDKTKSVDHIMFLCPYAMMVWRQSSLYLPIFGSVHNSVEDKIEAIFHYHDLQTNRFLKHLPFWIM